MCRIFSLSHTLNFLLLFVSFHLTLLVSGSKRTATNGPNTYHPMVFPFLSLWHSAQKTPEPNSANTGDATLAYEETTPTQQRGGRDSSSASDEVTGFSPKLDLETTLGPENLTSAFVDGMTLLDHSKNRGETEWKSITAPDAQEITAASEPHSRSPESLEFAYTSLPPNEITNSMQFVDGGGVGLEHDMSTPFADTMTVPPFLLDFENITTEEIPLVPLDPPPPLPIMPGWRTFVWNKTQMETKEYQQTYCSRRCKGTEIIDLHTFRCPELTCFPCDCNKPLCEIYSTCCPDFSETSAPPDDAVADISENSSYGPSWTESAANDDRKFESEPETERHRAIFTTNDSIKDARKYTPRYHSSGISGATANNLVCEQLEDKPYALVPDILVIRSCPPLYPNMQVKSMCEDEPSPMELTVAQFIHVFDNATGAVYYNEFCAKCHQVMQTKPWKMFVSCEHYMNVYQALSYDEFLRLSFDPQSNCTVRQKPALDLEETEYLGCDKDWFENVIDKCNITRQWPDYDADIVKACEEDTTIVGAAYRVRPSAPISGYQSGFKNIFCAICNMRTYPRDQPYCGPQQQIKPVIFRTLPFSFLISFGSRNSPKANVLTSGLATFHNCSTEEEWPSPEQRCLPLQCSPGKRLVDGNCSTIVEEIRGLAYKLRVMYLLQNSPEITSSTDSSSSSSGKWLVPDYLKSFESKVFNALRPVSADADIVLSIVILNYYTDSSSDTDEEGVRGKRWAVEHPSKENEGTSQLNMWLVLDGSILADKNYSRDDFEMLSLKEMLINDFIVTMPNNASVTFQPQLLTKEQSQQFSCSDMDGNHLCFSTIMFFPVSKSSSTLDVLKNEEFLPLTPDLTCPYVSFNKSDYILEANDTTLPPTKTVTLDLNVTQFIFRDAHELNLISIDNEGSLRICKELLDAKTNDYFGRARETYEDTANYSLYVITILCLFVSMLCLVLTLLTYFLFSELRSVAGKNNMCLCGTLLFAQLFLLISSQIRETGPGCAFLGILTHFLWLSTFCWCFVCCFHMFRVFTSTSRYSHISARSEKINFLKRIAICSASPALIIIVVIFANLANSAGTESGYGSTKCYLDSITFIVIAMILPLTVLVLGNLVFFHLTVLKIHKVRKLQSHADFKKSERKNLYIYVKLSTMTGVFWILQIIAEGVNNDPLRFFAVFLNGLQGVFIFLAYICNKRVFKLYVTKLGVEEHFPITLTTMRSTIGKAASVFARRSPKSEDTGATPEPEVASRVGEKMENSSRIGEKNALDDVAVEVVSQSHSCDETVSKVPTATTGLEKADCESHSHAEDKDEDTRDKPTRI